MLLCGLNNQLTFILEQSTANNHQLLLKFTITDVMPRKPRELKPDYCYHVTTRFNNREFKLLRHECRKYFPD